MKHYLVFITLFLIIPFLNCEKDLSPLKSHQSQIIPLGINNTWKFKSLSTGNVLEIKVIDKWKYRNHEIYKLNTGNFTLGFTNLFYIGDDLYDHLNDTTDVKVFTKKGPRFYSGITFSNYDTVVVPAGTFYSIKVKIMGYTGNSSFGSTTWYSFGVGPIKRESYFINWNGEKTVNVYVLESFSLN